MKRRHFFRGMTLGLGASYLSPFIAQLHAASPASSPVRVLFFVQGNGVYPEDIQPQGIPRKKEDLGRMIDRPLDEARMSMSLSPLSPWQDRMSIIHGLSSRVAIGSHNTGFAALGCWPMKKKAYGETVDAGLARHLGGIYRHVGLGASNRDSAIVYNLTSAARGRALPTLLNPVVAHKQYFAAGAEGAARKEFDVDTNLLDFLADDVKRMQSRLNTSEKERLDRYLEAFESMSARQSKLARMAEAIQRHTPAIDPTLGIISTSKTQATGVFDRLDAQFEIAAGCLIAGLTQTVTVSAGAGPDRIGLSCMASELGKDGGFIGAHGIGHGGTAAGLSSSQCHALIRKRCLEALAGFIQKLETIPEGEGTMLDHTLIVYCSDSAEGHHPGCKQWPFVLIGDLGGRLKLGNRYLQYPEYGQPGHRTLANLYLSILQAVGDSRSRFGIQDTGLLDLDQDGPLRELMV